MREAEYHEMRAAQERAIAEIAVNPAVQNIHRGLAKRHAEIADTIRRGKPLINRHAQTD